MAKHRDTQQVKVKQPPKSAPANTIVYEDLKMKQGGSVKTQKLPKGVK